MTYRRMWFVILIAAISFLPALWGCDGSGDNGEGEPANPAFNGTFSGNLTTTQGGATFTDTVTVNLTVGSPLSGTVTSDSGLSGTISGDATGNTASFRTTFNSDCPGSAEGSATLTDDTLSISLSGSDCDGLFTSTGTLNRIGGPDGTDRLSALETELVGKYVRRGSDLDDYFIFHDDRTWCRFEITDTGRRRNEISYPFWSLNEDQPVDENEWRIHYRTFGGELVTDSHIFLFDGTSGVILQGGFDNLVAFASNTDRECEGN